jgi:hypothetical protein
MVGRAPSASLAPRARLPSRSRSRRGRTRRVAAGGRGMRPSLSPRRARGIPPFRAPPPTVTSAARSNSPSTSSAS